MPDLKRARRVDSPSIFCFSLIRKTHCEKCSVSWGVFVSFHRIWQDFHWFWNIFCSLEHFLLIFGVFWTSEKFHSYSCVFFASSISVEILILGCLYARKQYSLLLLIIFDFHWFWNFWFFCYNMMIFRYYNQKSMKINDFHSFSLVFDYHIEIPSYYSKKMKILKIDGN